jgi:hypothetical protein
MQKGEAIERTLQWSFLWKLKEKAKKKNAFNGEKYPIARSHSKNQKVQNRFQM